jgi:hypothetical protein
MKGKILMMLAIGTAVITVEADAQTGTSQKNSQPEQQGGNTSGKGDTDWYHHRYGKTQGSLHTMKPGKTTRSSESVSNPNSISTVMENGKQLDRAIASWPQAPRKTVEKLRAKYGEPDEIKADEVIWNDTGNWKMIIVSRKEAGAKSAG